MVWNAAGTFHTRLSATALTANRKFVFPDLDGTFVVASAGVVNVDRISASSVFATVLSANNAFIVVGSNGTYTQGAVYSDANWGMILRAKQSAPLIAAFSFRRADDTELMRIDTAGNATVVGNITAASGIITGALAVGSTLTVSGTAVIGNLTVPGRISASAVGVVGALSVGGTLAVSGVATFNTTIQMLSGTLFVGRQNSTIEGGEIELARAFDNAVEYIIDCIGSGTAATESIFRMFDATGGLFYNFNRGFRNHQWDGNVATFSMSAVAITGRLDVAGLLSVSGVATFSDAIILSGTAVISDFIRLGGATTVAPFNTVGSIQSTATGAAGFRNTLKCWVQFGVAAGAISLNTQFNVSAVTRASSGVYTVNLTNASLSTSFPYLTATISGTAGTTVRAGGLTSTQSFGIVTTVGAVATDASAVAAGACDQ